MSTTNLAAQLAPAAHPRTPRLMGSDDGLDQTEALMLELCSGARLDRLGAMLWEHVSCGGKRLRARLALAATAAMGGRREDAVPWAAACELLHNATLVHDDVQDQDKVRRGREALWVRHGIPQAINAGDLALMLPTLALRKADALSGEQRWVLAEAIASHAEEVVRGQALEIDLLSRNQVDWRHYAEAARGKTSALFSLPVFGAAVVAGRSPDEARELADAFGEIGLLFQIQDDVLDLYGDKGRGCPGSDLREGKVSALVVEHLSLHPQDEEWLIDLLEAPRDSTPERAVEHAIECFRTGGALDAVWRRLETIQDRISDTPAMEQHHRLHAVALNLVGASLAPIAHTHPNPGSGGPT